MKVLQIGSGSMGTRRLRDLHQRADVTLALFDQRADRRAAAQARFGVKVFAQFDDALAWGPQALVISTPPGTKGPYVNLAFDRGLHHFSEADMWTYGAALRAAQNPGIVSAPSGSLSFLPLFQQLGPLIDEHLGGLLGYQLFLSTYMPSWHPQEGLEYYARHRNTAPAREMIPFELNCLNALFGPACAVAGRYEKFGDLPGDAEDTWSLSMRLSRGGMGHLTITMASPVDYRKGVCLGTKGMATWDVYGGVVTLQTAADREPRRLAFGPIGGALEQSYSQEINTFIDATLGRTTWGHSYALAQAASATLAAAEKSSLAGGWVAVDPAAEPEFSLPRPT
jgi:predicted dehydrogenase